MADPRGAQRPGDWGARPWFPVPHSSPLIPGVLAWRGRAVAILDLAVLASAGEPLRGGVRRPRTLIVESSGCVLAMPVDAVREVQEVDDARVRRSHVTSLGHSSLEVEVFGTFAPVVDLASLVASVADGAAGGHEP